MIIDSWIQDKIKRDRDSGRFISVAKAISWRIVGTIDTWIISYILTGQVQLAFSIASIEALTKITLYYFHERVWEKVRVRKTNSKTGE